MKVCRAPLAWLATAAVLMAALGTMPLTAAAAPGANATAPVAMALTRGTGGAPTPFQWLDMAGATRLPLVGDDVSSQLLDLGFAVSFYGKTYRQVALSSNGLLTFDGPRPLHYANVSLPARGGPGTAIAAFWDDLMLLEDSTLSYRRGGTAPNRWFVATWDRAGFVADADARISFQAVLWEDGRVTLSYGQVEHWQPQLWNSATVGMQGAAGRQGLGYRWNATGSPLAAQTSLQFAPAGGNGGPQILDLRIVALHAGLYRVTARVEDSEGRAIEEVQLQVTSLNFSKTPITMAAHDQDSRQVALTATALLDTMGMPDGIYALSVRARNEANVWGESAGQEITIDQAPPTTTCTFSKPDGDNDWYRSDVTVTCTATDKGSEVDRIEYQIDGGDWQPYSGELRIKGQGIRYLAYRAADRAGNLEMLQLQTIGIDREAPVVSVSGLEPGQRLRHSDTLRVQAEAAEADSGLAELRLDLDGTDDLPNGDATSLWPLELGEHTLTVIARDRAGNLVEKGPLTFYIYADIQSIEILASHLLGSRGADLKSLRENLARAARAEADGDRWAARQYLLACAEVLQQALAQGQMTNAAYNTLITDLDDVINRLTGAEDCQDC